MSLKISKTGSDLVIFILYLVLLLLLPVHFLFYKWINLCTILLSISMSPVTDDLMETITGIKSFEI